MPVNIIQDQMGQTLALVISDTTKFPAGHNFFTQPKDELQFAVFNHPKNHSIQRHWHPTFTRTLSSTCEVLVIQTGLVKASIYDSNFNLIHVQELKAGDVAVLFSGGHGFEILEDTLMLEIKQGPYAGTKDKETF